MFFLNFSERMVPTSRCMLSQVSARSGIHYRSMYISLYSNYRGDRSHSNYICDLKSTLQIIDLAQGDLDFKTDPTFWPGSLSGSITL